VLARIGRKLDGRPAAASTVSRKRAVFHNALEYAVERELLPQNPLPVLKTKKSRTVEAVDKRVVVSPDQAVRLLEAVRAQGRSGRHLVAFLGLLYYGALRPAEAGALSKGDIAIPDEGWGQLYLPRSAPTTGTHGAIAASAAIGEALSTGHVKRSASCRAHHRSPSCCTDTSPSSELPLTAG
jgi:integrase